MDSNVRKVRTAVICFTAAGSVTARRIGRFYRCEEIWCRKKEPLSPEAAERPRKEGGAGSGENSGEERVENSAENCGEHSGNGRADPVLRMLEEPLSSWTEKRFGDCSRLVFVGATGIAVRSIAPYLKSKKTDPAVLCVDEAGRFVISLVSGHIGGANEDTLALAGCLGAIPVITTATDLNGLFAVDVFASRNGLHISDMALAKEVAAALLDRRMVTFSCEGTVKGTLPPELSWLRGPDLSDPKYAADDKRLSGRRPACHIHVGVHTLEGWLRAWEGSPENGISGDSREQSAWEGSPENRGLEKEKRQPSLREENYLLEMERAGKVLYLIPRAVVLGCGCRKGKDPGEMRRFLHGILREEGLHEASLASLCSIDLKKEEQALLSAAGELGVPFRCFTSEELNACKGDFCASSFVRGITGTDNVCERSAVLGSGGRLLFHKKAQDGMTAAAAVGKWEVRF